MAPKRPSYEDWRSQPDLSGESPDTPEGHRALIWLWIIGLIIFSAVVLGLGILSSYLQPGPHYFHTFL